MSRELGLRIGSAAVIVPAIVLLSWFGGATFAAVVASIAVIAFFEWLDMLGLDRFGWRHGTGALLLAGLGLAALALPMPLALTLMVLLAFALSRIGYGLRRTRRATGPAGQGGWIAAGFIYVGLPLVCFIALRNGGSGLAVILFVIVCAAGSDTLAFFVGRAVGGPKLWRRVSPAKTWSGAVGGLVGGSLAGLVVAYLAGLPTTMATVALAAALATVGILGDLLESAIKRHFGVKDAGRIIPGHGGVMDRVDGIAAAGVFAVAVATAFAPNSPPSSALLGLMALS
jgi:phosphatidate cytidylyltransferase